MPGEEAAVDRHIKRQRARGGKGVDVQQGLLRGVCRQGEATEAQRQGNRTAKHGSSMASGLLYCHHPACHHPPKRPFDPVITTGGGYSSAVSSYSMPPIPLP